MQNWFLDAYPGILTIIGLAVLDTAVRVIGHHVRWER